MWKSVFRSVMVTLILCVILCGVYPLVVTLLANTMFPDKAKGSLVYRDGKVVGSRLIGQAFTRPEYFHGRPSAAGDKGYDAASSGGSNLGPTSQKLADRIKGDVDNALKENPTLTKGKIPVDMVTASGSGLDPDVSVDSALAQVDRVAGARNAGKEDVRRIVIARVQNRWLGFLGERRVNVLLLNLSLDDALPVKK